MVLVQVDLADEENEVVELFKIKNKLLTKEDAIKKMVINSKPCNHKFEVIDNSKSSSVNRITQRCINCGIIRVDKIYSLGDIETIFSKK